MTRAPDTISPDGLLLPGLDGSNPLGFLAALGLFITLANVPDYSQTRFCWVPAGGTWAAWIDANITADTLLGVLDTRLAKDIELHPIELLEQLGKLSAAQRGQFIRDCITDLEQHTWIASLTSSIADPKQNNQLQTARRDYYFGNLASVISRTERRHLERTLFHSWDYADALDNQSLHLDPSEDRRHAYQWNKPAGDPDRKKSGGMLGANRLAIEALYWFASIPENDQLHTVGFTGRSTKTRWTWPIWRVPISATLVPPLLALPTLQNDAIAATDVTRLHERGVAAAYRTRRILVGKTRNFTPAKQIA